MALYELPNATEGMDAILVDVATTIPSFIPMFLVFVFAVILIGGVSSQKRRSGYSDFPMWAVLSSIATLLVTLPMTLISGLINITTLAIVVIVTLMSGLWFFMSKGRYEH